MNSKAEHVVFLQNPTTGEPMKTVVQNENAFSDYMKLYTAFDAMLYMLLP